MTDATLIVVVGFFSTLIGLVVGLYRENRNRKWDIQDRNEKAEVLRQETVAAAETVKRAAEEAARTLSRKVEEAAEKVEQEAVKIRADVAENTRVSEAAKVAAEDASMQIVDIESKITDLKTNGFKP